MRKPIEIDRFAHPGQKLRRLTDAQHDVFAVWQLPALGLSTDAARLRCRRGPRLPHPPWRVRSRQPPPHPVRALDGRSPRPWPERGAEPSGRAGAVGAAPLCAQGRRRHRPGARATQQRPHRRPQRPRPRSPRLHAPRGDPGHHRGPDAARRRRDRHASGAPSRRRGRRASRAARHARRSMR